MRHSGFITKTRLWRDSGRPEASLIGVQYEANGKADRRAWMVRESVAGRWLLARTGLHEGSALSRGGVEIDSVAPSSPRPIEVLAEIPHLFGTGRTAQMTYYESRSGARVFAAGAFYFVRMVNFDPVLSRVVENLWARMTTR